eukprot:scaffold101650_cov22-Tisochrysis_lutea.AAC.4
MRAKSCAYPLEQQHICAWAELQRGLLHKPSMPTLTSSPPTPASFGTGGHILAPAGYWGAPCVGWAACWRAWAGKCTPAAAAPPTACASACRGANREHVSMGFGDKQGHFPTWQPAA